MLSNMAVMIQAMRCYAFLSSELGRSVDCLNFYIYASLTLAVTGKTLQMHQIIGWVFLWAGFGQVLGRYAKKLSLIY